MVRILRTYWDDRYNCRVTVYAYDPKAEQDEPHLCHARGPELLEAVFSPVTAEWYHHYCGTHRAYASHT